MNDISIEIKEKCDIMVIEEMRTTVREYERIDSKWLL